MQHVCKIDTPLGEVTVPLITLLTWRRGIQLEIKTGMQLSRGRSCSAIAKSTLGFRMNLPKQDILDVVEDLIGQVEKQQAANKTAA